MRPETIEDIERADWYARLAFGVYSETVKAPSAQPERTTPVFNVMP
jgi:hypothetical protein